MMINRKGHRQNGRYSGGFVQTDTLEYAYAFSMMWSV